MVPRPRRHDSRIDVPTRCVVPVRDDVTDPDLSAAIDELRAVGKAPGVTAWTIEMSLDTRKGGSSSKMAVSWTGPHSRRAGR